MRLRLPWLVVELRAYRPPRREIARPPSIKSSEPCEISTRLDQMSTWRARAWCNVHDRWLSECINEEHARAKEGADG